MRKFTDEELTYRLWDKEEIKNTMSRHSYYLANDDRERELCELWVAKPKHQADAILGYNNGYYKGIDSIRKHYVDDAKALRLEALKPYLEAGQDVPAGQGFMSMHTVNTPLIELAEDGRTAKYVGYDCGLYCVGKPDGDSDSYFIFGRVYADLVSEDGTFKLWHLLMTYDHVIPAGRDYGEVPPQAPWGSDLVEQACGTPDIPDVVYDGFYGWVDMWERLPRPYESYDPKTSYGPDGKPKCYQIGLYK